MYGLMASITVLAICYSLCSDCSGFSASALFHFLLLSIIIQNLFLLRSALVGSYGVTAFSSLFYDKSSSGIAPPTADGS